MNFNNNQQYNTTSYNYNTVTPRFGDIYYAKLTGEGSEQKGYRPIVIIQNDIGNKHSPTVIYAAVTSKLKAMHLPTHVLIEPDKKNGLEKESMILLEQVNTINKTKLLGKIGSISDESIIKQIEDAVMVSMSRNCHRGQNRFVS